VAVPVPVPMFAMRIVIVGAAVVKKGAAEKKWNQFGLAKAGATSALVFVE